MYIKYVNAFLQGKIQVEREFILIIITSLEKEIIAERMPNVHIRRTVKQKSKRHKYYMEENKNSMRLLNKLRVDNT